MQLKKSDLLAVITAEAMTKGEIVDALDEYDFIPSYLDYLLDHFEARNKIVKNEDGNEVTWQLRAKKSGGSSNEVYRVVETEDGFEMETGKIGEVDNSDNNWSKTPKAAIKKATSAIFAHYKEQTAAVKELLSSVEEETSDQKAA